MPNTLPTRSRRALAAAAVAVLALAGACSESPTAPSGGTPRAEAASALAKRHPGRLGGARGRRGGYNVVAD